MRRLALFAIVVSTLALTGAPRADARDLRGRFGIGADASMGWSFASPRTAEVDRVEHTGLSAIYYIAEMFALQLVISSVVTTGSLETTREVDTLAWRTSTAVRAIVPIALTNDVNLGLVAGFSGVFAAADQFTETADDDVSPIYISFELGLRPEWFVGDALSFHTQIGFVVSLVNEDQPQPADGSTVPLQDAGGATFDVFANADLVGNAGFTFWF